MDEEEVDEEELYAVLSKYSYEYLRKFSLGVLRLSPDEFGKRLFVDIIDALVGYRDEKFEEHKKLAELVRGHASLLFNLQLPHESKMTEIEMWRFPWEEDPAPVVIDKDEYDEQIRKAEELFKAWGR